MDISGGHYSVYHRADCLNFNPGSAVYLLFFPKANYLNFPSPNLLMCEMMLKIGTCRIVVRIRLGCTVYIEDHNNCHGVSTQ